MYDGSGAVGVAAGVVVDVGSATLFELVAVVLFNGVVVVVVVVFVVSAPFFKDEEAEPADEEDADECNAVGLARLPLVVSALLSLPEL